MRSGSTGRIINSSGYNANNLWRPSSAVVAVATRLAFSPAGTPPGGVTTDTTAPKSGAQGWTSSPYFGFNDRGTSGIPTNSWLWRGGGIGYSDIGTDSAKYRVVCAVGGTIAVRAYGYDNANLSNGPYLLRQRLAGGTYAGDYASSPNAVLGTSGAVSVGTFTDTDNAGYIDLRMVWSSGQYYTWCGLDFVASSSTADLPTAWTF